MEKRLSLADLKAKSKSSSKSIATEKLQGGGSEVYTSGNQNGCHSIWISISYGK